MTFAAINKPTFICMGAQRAGTTWLHNRLIEHPSVFLPKSKELQFFNAHFDRGLDWYWRQFSETDKRIRGEVTPNYMHSKAAIQRIAQYLPDAKLLVVVRNPLDRTYSAYQLYRDSRFQGMSLEAACEKASYLYTQSIYAPALDSIRSFFPRNQIHVAVYDELVRDPQNFLHGVCDFIDVSMDDLKGTPITPRQDNKVLVPELQSMIRAARLEVVINLVKKSRFESVVRNALERFENKRKPVSNELKTSLRRYLPLFVEDQRRLTDAWGLPENTWDLE